LKNPNPNFLITQTGDTNNRSYVVPDEGQYAVVSRKNIGWKDDAPSMHPSKRKILNGQAHLPWP